MGCIVRCGGGRIKGGKPGWVYSAATPFADIKKGQPTGRPSFWFDRIFVEIAMID